MARYFDYAGGELTNTSLRMPGSNDTYENGDPVPSDGRLGMLVVFVNGPRPCDSPEPAELARIVPANYVPQDGDRISIRFIPVEAIYEACASQ
ncbi:MAG: hypothetical protein WD904_01640 [Dehalococcoidia bacterium]